MGRPVGSGVATRVGAGVGPVVGVAVGAWVGLHVGRLVTVGGLELGDDVRATHCRAEDLSGL